MGSFAGRNKFGEKTEPAGLVIHLGKTRISRQGRAVPAECSAARQLDWKQRRVSEGTRSVGEQLCEIALDELAVQPDRDYPVRSTDGQRAVAGNFAVA